MVHTQPGKSAPEVPALEMVPVVDPDGAALSSTVWEDLSIRDEGSASLPSQETITSSAIITSFGVKRAWIVLSEVEIGDPGSTIQAPSSASRPSRPSRSLT
jgi:hypothetical protein